MFDTQNGGTTLSTLMQRLEEQQECLFWGYRLTRWKRMSALLHALNGSTKPLPRLCVDAHVGIPVAGSHVLRDLGALQAHWRKRGIECTVWRTTRVREPLSYYRSFWAWGPSSRYRHESWRLGDAGFMHWANATPNLQANVLLDPQAGIYAIDLPHARRAGAQPGYMSAEGPSGEERLRELLSNLDLVAPLERFDEALLMTADVLGLRHIQYAPIDPACGIDKPHRLPLDIERECAWFSEQTQRCYAHEDARRARKGCAPTNQAACADVVRRVAPLDDFLYRQGSRDFSQRMWALGPDFQQRVAAFKSAAVGIFRGGAPRKARCRFQRLSATQAKEWRWPDFPRDPCTSVSQGLGEAIWQDRGFIRSASLVEVDAGHARD
jgi:hypothetical protein